MRGARGVLIDAAVRALPDPASIGVFRSRVTVCQPLASGTPVPGDFVVVVTTDPSRNAYQGVLRYRVR